MIKTGIIFSIATLLLLSSALVRAQPQSREDEMFAVVKSCDLAKVKTLSTERPVLLQIKDNNGATLLHLATGCVDLTLAQFLIEQKADVDASDNNNRTPLAYAAVLKNLGLVKLLVANHAKVNAKDSSGYTPLHFGDVETVKFLLENGADPNAVDRNGGTILHYKPEKELIGLLQGKGFNFNARDSYRNTPLHIAVKGAAVRCTEKKTPEWFSTAGLEDVRALIDAGSDINLQDGEGLTPLMLGSNYEELVTLLLRKGVIINAVDSYVGSVLHRIVQSPFPETRSLVRDPHRMSPPPCSLDLDPIKKLEFFLTHGADPNVKSHNGLTVLATLATRTDGANLVKAARLLLTYHADLNVRDKNGNSVLHLAAAAKNAALVELFLEQGVDPNVKNSKGETPLHQTSDIDIANLLLKFKANPRAEDDEGKRPIYHAVESGSPELVKLLIALKSYSSFDDIFSTLHLAARRGNVEIMEALVKAGAKVDRMGNDRQTPLHEAVANPTSTALENVKFLIAHGARVNARDKYNNTPLHAALEAGPTEATLEAAKFLLANGANPNIKNIFGQTPLDNAKFHRKYMEPDALNQKQDEIIALLESIMVVVPERRVFGQVKLADGTTVKATVGVSDAESWASLGRMETKDDGQFEFHLPEGQQFRMGANFQIQKDGKRLLYISDQPRPILTVNKDDIGPLVLTLNRVVTLPPK